MTDYLAHPKVEYSNDHDPTTKSNKYPDESTTFEDFYENHPFTFLSKNDINLKEVINTNNCHLKIEFHENIIHITTVLDNLLKGASGQAVQNLNIIYGYEESLGLNFKGSIY